MNQVDVDLFKRHLGEAVRSGILDVVDAEEVAENLEAILRLARRGIITSRLAHHLVDTMAQRKAQEWRARHPEWNPGSEVQ